MKTKITEKTIGVYNTPICRSANDRCGIMASRVEVEMNGRKAPDQVAVWMEEGESSIRAEFSLEQAGRFARELLVLVKATKPDSQSQDE